jgi:DNA invertase Pin-like site-specific DNA recombinase
VRGTIAEYEHAKIHERTTRGLRGRAQAGHVGGGQVPLGYRVSREPHKGRWEIQPQEATLVKRIYQMAHEGMSCRAVESPILLKKGSKLIYYYGYFILLKQYYLGKI